MRHISVCLLAGVLSWSVCPAFAADPPTREFWSGRQAEKTQLSGLSQSAASVEVKPAGDTKPAPSQPAQFPPRKPREPEWLRRMDKHERTTLTGGWKLQNWSGGTQTQTTAGDRSGMYAPNSYQGAQFQQWNNVANRQNIPSWNGTTNTFPSQLWSQGYVSPNNYAGPGAQSWSNMSPGAPRMNSGSGGWSTTGW